MQPRGETGRYVWLAAIPGAMIIAWRVYVATQSTPGERPFAIVSVVSVLAVVGGLALHRYLRPEQRVSKIALVVIALVLIFIAVLFRHQTAS